MTSSVATVLVGPTAVGKGTVIDALKRLHPEVVVSVSATTRHPRPGEIEGVHYHFIDRSAFNKLVDEGQMLEWALVHGADYYGTPREPVEEKLAEGKPVLLEIDIEGARQIRKTMPEARIIFLTPPSWGELERRLIGRGTEGAAERRRRLETAHREMAAQNEADHIVVNDDVSRAAAKLARLMGLK